ncbi:hypothetical protein PVAP13_7NG426801 [Panicum virgatum]|uniref:Uncharacterized protein n=1 Tax=Panicum virgatum TaxID=38727 RepID=A0A8T0QHA7_PANVG|nr:hypothetical protein PVAP13_7NG426801 [Panicum virgatum]
MGRWLQRGPRRGDREGECGSPYAAPCKGTTIQCMHGEGWLRLHQMHALLLAVVVVPLLDQSCVVSCDSENAQATSCNLPHACHHALAAAIAARRAVVVITGNAEIRMEVETKRMEWQQRISVYQG